VRRPPSAFNVKKFPSYIIIIIKNTTPVSLLLSIMQQYDRGKPLLPPDTTNNNATTNILSPDPALKSNPFTAGKPGSQMSLQDATPPISDPSPQEAEALLSGALHGVSSEERDQALADVHGVTSASAMDNEFFASRLAQLDQAISDCKSKSAFLRAKIQDPEYVSNRSFRLQFLMADSFQPKAAAERLVSYFESKLVLFGPAKLTHDLALDDLCTEDMKCLQHGVVQRLMGQDHAGRVVVSCWPTTLQEQTVCVQNKVRRGVAPDVACPVTWKGHTSLYDEAAHDDSITTLGHVLTFSSIEPLVLRQLRALWYLVTSIVSEESEMAQRNGFVLVIFGMGPRAQVDRLALWKLMYILRSLPTRVASVHFCYDDPEAEGIANLAVMALDRKSRARFRTHYGKFEPCVGHICYHL
jgi:hypothetical protein